jgi:DNA damage-inducible protein 1
MLRAHQACIDLEKNVLRIQNREVRFLSEHELPDKAREFESGVGDSNTSAATSTTAPSASSRTPTSFPGSGNTLGTPPAGAPNRGSPMPQSNAGNRHSEEAIATLVGLGVSREVAISTLDAAGGNLDVAASLLF